MSTRPAPFYGWVVLSAAFAIIALSIGTLFTLGVFVKPIEAGLGWSRASIGGIGLLNWLVMGVGGVVSGHLSDRFGTRIVVLGGGVVLGFGLVLSGQVREPWHLYAAFGVLVGAGVSAFYVPLTVLAVRWFDHQRGLAAAIVSAGNGLGILALAPLARWLIDGYDWRTAFVLLGDLAWLVVIPCALLLRPAPSPSAVSRPGEGPPAPEASLGRILLAWPIWAIALTHFACCAAHSGPLFHLVTHAMDQGIASMTAASIFGMSGLSSIVGRIGGGLLADRFGTKRTLIAMLVAQAAMIPIYTLATGEQALWGLSLAFGVTYGGVMPIYAVVTREYFGDAVMGTAYGWVFFISCIGMGLGSFAGGVIYDALGSYQTLFLGSFAVGAMAAVLGFTLPRSRLVGTPRLA